VVSALLTRALIREEVTDRRTRADSALNTIWRNEDDGRAVVLKITPSGLAAIGVEREADRDEVAAYRFNEGTNSAGEPAAGAPSAADTAPVEPAPKKRGRPRKAAPTARGTGSPRKTRDGSKQAQLIDMLRRKQGATIAQIVEATGWQPHTVRGAFAGALKKKLGLTVTSEKPAGKDRVYRLT